jgi:hypothetical protein
MKNKNQKPNPNISLKNYKEVLYFKLTENLSRIVLLNALSIVSLIIFGLPFLAFAIIFGKLPSSVSFDLLGMTVLLVSIIFTLFLHEAVHAVLMKIFGATPIFGFIFPIAIYTTSPGFAYKRNDYLLIALAPLLVISMLYFLLTLIFSGSSLIFIFLICAAINASGAVGDLWISKIVLGYSKKAYILDEKDGVRVFLAKE